MFNVLNALLALKCFCMGASVCFIHSKLLKIIILRIVQQGSVLFIKFSCIFNALCFCLFVNKSKFHWPVYCSCKPNWIKLNYIQIGLFPWKFKWHLTATNSTNSHIFDNKRTFWFNLLFFDVSFAICEWFTKEKVISVTIFYSYIVLMCCVAIRAFLHWFSESSLITRDFKWIVLNATIIIKINNLPALCVQGTLILSKLRRWRWRQQQQWTHTNILTKKSDKRKQ